MIPQQREDRASWEKWLLSRNHEDATQTMEAAITLDDDLAEAGGGETFTFLPASCSLSYVCQVQNKRHFDSIFCWKYKRGNFHLICWLIPCFICWRGSLMDFLLSSSQLSTRKSCRCSPKAELVPPLPWSTSITVFKTKTHTKRKQHCTGTKIGKCVGVLWKAAQLSDKGIFTKSNICRGEWKSRWGERRPRRQHGGRQHELFSARQRAISGISNCQIQEDQTDKLDEICTQGFVMCSVFRFYISLPELTMQHMRVLRCSLFSCNKKHRIWQTDHSKITAWTFCGPTLQRVEFSTAALLFQLRWPSSNLDLQRTTHVNLQSAGK